ncbi:MAG: glycosyltransferase family 39 protein [Myxococcales bacterium]|jgi:hypothetical protein|nr:glycosyltransferase family 39 protein [Myxococcales bacterium]
MTKKTRRKRPPPSPRERASAPAAAPTRAVEGPADEASLRRGVALLGAAIAALSLVRLYAARTVGFGDSEALYASYALHPQPTYLDHPGLVGEIMRAIGGGGAPTPATTHALTTCLLAVLPWAGVLAARGAGATARRALAMGWLLVVTPEIAIGLFAMTPDVPLAFAWLGAIGGAAAWLGGDPSDKRRALAAVLAGLAAGVASAAKVSGLLLFPILAAAYLHPATRRHARTPWPWAGLAAGLVVVAPSALYEWRAGFPLFVHRLVSTQASAGASLRNAGALLGGQLLYVSPLLVALGALVGRAVIARRRQGPVDFLLFVAFAVPAVLLGALCVWSRVAEPHWIAPAWLALGLAHCRAPAAPSRPRLERAALALAALVTLLAHAWVLAPQAVRLRPDGVDARFDIANELYGWPTAIAHANELAAAERSPADPDGRDLVLVGPHWTVCAQLRAGLARGIRVGCMTPIRDDFDGWEPRPEWRKAERIVFVSDNRYGPEPPEPLPDHARGAESRVSFFRGGRLVRTFTFRIYERRARASL